MHLCRPSLAAQNAGAAQPTYVAFTESFQSWPIPMVCEKFKAIGLDGLDLTVRPGGHIEPADAPKKLPAAVQSARQHGLQIPMLTTSIVEADHQADKLLAVAGSLGIDRIKLGYYPYQQFGTLRQQIDAVKQKLDGVAKLAARHKVLPMPARPLRRNHTGQRPDGLPGRQGFRSAGARARTSTRCT